MCNTREENAAELAREAMQEDHVYRCPECKEEDDFRIDAAIQTVAYVNGRGELEYSQDGDMEWGRDSLMLCNTCEHAAPVKDFEIEHQAKRRSH